MSRRHRATTQTHETYYVDFSEPECEFDISPYRYWRPKNAETFVELRHSHSQTYGGIHTYGEEKVPLDGEDDDDNGNDDYEPAATCGGIHDENIIRLCTHFVFIFRS